jgi:hypothetical protein
LYFKPAIITRRGQIVKVIIAPADRSEGKVLTDEIQPANPSGAISIEY